MIEEVKHGLQVAEEKQREGGQNESQDGGAAEIPAAARGQQPRANGRQQGHGIHQAGAQQIRPADAPEQQRNRQQGQNGEHHGKRAQDAGAGLGQADVHGPEEGQQQEAEGALAALAADAVAGHDGREQPDQAEERGLDNVEELAAAPIAAPAIEGPQDGDAQGDGRGHQAHPISERVPRFTAQFPGNNRQPSHRPTPNLWRYKD